MRTNVAQKQEPQFTHEGARSPKISAAKELRRSVMCSMLFEGTFYESGEDHATRLRGLIGKTSFAEAAAIAIEAREKMKLRHVPLLITRELIRNHSGRQVGDLIAQVIQRPDEAAELLAMYWADGSHTVTKQMRIGLGRALKKFSAYQLAKWDLPGSVALRDVLFQTHARPISCTDTRFTRDERRRDRDRKHGSAYVLNSHEQVYKQLAEKSLPTPDTWETQLSGGADKKETFTRLIKEGKLGALALLRNLRGMLEAGVNEDTIRYGILKMSTERVLPFRFIAAARHAPRLEDALEPAMLACVANLEKLPGKTALLVDHSMSMEGTVSEKSEISRFDAAAALAMILRDAAERCRVFTFSSDCVEIPPRRGFAMLEAIRQVRKPESTLLGKAVKHIYNVFPECDRIIVVTDEQSQDRPPQPRGTGWIVNVGTYKNGVAYGAWNQVDGWSESILDYIRAYEENA